MGAGMRYQPQGGGRRVSGSSPLGRIDFLWTAGAGNVDAISGTLANKRGPNLIGPSGLFADMSSAGYTNTTFSNTSAVGSPYTIVMVLAFQNASVADHIVVRQTANVGNFRIQAQSGTTGIGINFVHQGVALGTLVVASPIPGGFNTLNPWVYVCTYDGTIARQYLTDGVNRYTASDTIGYSAVAASTFEFNPTSAPSFPLQLFAVGNRAISADEVRSIQANPWQLFQAPEEEFEVTSAGTNTAVNPGVGTIALTGYAPTVAQSANQSVTPSTGSITITGYAPTVVQPHAVNPGAGSLTITGYAPTVTQAAASQNILPGVGSLTITGYAPTVVQSGQTNFGGVPFFHSEYANAYRRKKAEEKDVSDAQPAVELSATAEPDAAEIESAIEQIAAPSALSVAKAKAKRALQAELNRQEAAYQKLQAKQLEEQLQRQAEEHRNAQMIQELQALIQKDLEEQDEEEAMLLLM